MKERLIGAAVLVTLGVWLIPWVLDGQGEQSESRSTALQLPVSEQPVPIRSQTIRLDEERQAPAPAAESTLKVVAAQDPEPATATADVVAEDTPPVVTTALVERDVEKSQPVTPPETATSAAPTPSASAPPPPLAESAPTPSAASSAPTRSAAVASSQSGWFVQLGSFSEEENARRLAQRVSTFGYRADITTHRASGRVMYRVRVGPEGSRGRAQAAASALTAHGFPAQIVAAD